jgi:hypothetical protein
MLFRSASGRSLLRICAPKRREFTPVNNKRASDPFESLDAPGSSSPELPTQECKSSPNSCEWHI